MRTELSRTPTHVVEGFRGQFWQRGTIGSLGAWYCPEGPEGGHAVVRMGEDAWLVAAHSSAVSALAAVRLCREIQRMRLACHRAVTVHSSLVILPGLGGVLFAGASGAGKTTLSLALAQRGGFVVDTDQLYLLDYGGVGMLGAGLPNAHRVGAGTWDRLSQVSGASSVALLRGSSADLDGNPKYGKTWVTALEAEVVHRVASAPAARIDVIVLLTAEHGLVEPRLKGLGRDQAVAWLRRETLAADLLHAEFWLAEPDEIPPTGVTERDIGEVVGRIPMASLHWDPTRHDIGDVLRCLHAKFPGMSVL
ncbi:phosphoenolpyruvate carboxykinase (ATP) [Nonomuraea montanisoli]|uniref:hypothetical protein n=1 Tax=Nonomuraea montanisoli TaxID=2741721 RepID=UPI001963CD34|nr:hypothetical protein [Nonomuraea montanisoli]